MAYRDAVLADSPLHFWELQETLVAPTIVQVGTHAATVNTHPLTITLGAAPTAGNYLLLFIHMPLNSSIPAPPGAAWTQLLSNNAGGANGWYYTYGRAVSGDTATFAINFNTNTVANMVLYELAGVDLAAPFFANGLNAGLTANPFTPARGLSLLFYWGSGIGTSTFTPDTGWVEDADLATTVSGQIGSDILAHRWVGATSGSVTATATAAGALTATAAVIVSVKPALPAAADTGTSATNAPGTYRQGSNLTQLALAAIGPNRTDRAFMVTADSPVFTGIETADQPDLDILGDLTIEAWVRCDNFVEGGLYILTKGQVNAANVPYNFFVGNNAVPGFYSASSGGGTRRDGTGAVVGQGAWTHVAMVRSGTTLTFYLNGVSQAASGAVSVPTANAQGAALGSYQTGAGGTVTGAGDGQLAYVALWPSALSGAQIAAHYAARTVQGAYVTQAALEVLAVGTSTARVTQAGLEVLTVGTSLARLTQAALEVLTPSPLGITTYYDYILAESGLVGYWPLDEASGNAIDRTANHNDATPVGSWSYRASYQGPDSRAAARTNGSNASFDDTTVTGLPVGNAPWTFEVWIQIPPNYSSGLAVPLFTIGQANATEPQMTYVAQSAVLYILGGLTTLTGIPNLVDGLTHYLAGSWDGGQFVFYLDGVVCRAATFGWGYNAVYGTAGIRLARTNNHGVSAGVIYQDAALYNRALTAGQVLTHYRVGAGLALAPVPAGPWTPTGALDPLEYWRRGQSTRTFMAAAAGNLEYWRRGQVAVALATPTTPPGTTTARSYAYMIG